MCQLDRELKNSHCQFSTDGSRFAWGNQDVTLTVCDLPEMPRQLTEIGLGWIGGSDRS